MTETLETIFALATAPGKAGVAVVRISGSRANEVLSALGIEQAPDVRVAKLHRLTRANESEKPLIDHALVLRFEAPNSFTGENIVELHTHGSRAVIQDILSYLNTLPDFRLAEAGEFSRRAFANNKMDLTQVEGLADLIEAETSAQKTQAIRQLEGKLHHLYEGWRANLIETMAYLEAFIDFPDEDIPEDAYDNIRVSAEILRNDLQLHLSDNRGERLRDGLMISILGEPNVGKSSLLNYLAKRDVAIVSDVAGTTRDFLEVHMDIAGYPVTLVDTAGIRETEDVIEIEGVRRSKERASQSDFKLLLLDAGKLDEISADVVEMIDENTLVVMNKSDVNDHIPPTLLGASEVISISIHQEKNIDLLLSRLQNAVDEKMQGVSESAHFTRERHRLLLQETADHLTHFINALDQKGELELLAEDARLTARSLGRLTGRIDVEDLLDAIFSSFCIGK